MIRSSIPPKGQQVHQIKTQYNISRSPPFNQPTQQSINKPTNQSAKPTNQSTNRPANLPIIQSTSRSASPSINQQQSTSQPINQQSTNLLFSLPIDQLVHQLVIQSIYSSTRVHQSINQSNNVWSNQQSIIRFTSQSTNWYYSPSADPCVQERMIQSTN